MSDTRHNQCLNLLLIRLVRSLLQYAAECWPWASVEESGEQQVIVDLGHYQVLDVRQLVDLLVERGWAIDFGNYPTDFTDLNYIGLDFLLGELLADEEKLIAAMERGHADLMGDPAAAALVSGLLATERSRLAKLRELAASQKAATGAAAATSAK